MALHDFQAALYLSIEPEEDRLNSRSKHFLVIAPLWFLLSFSSLLFADEVRFCIEDRDHSPYIKPDDSSPKKATGFLVDFVDKASKHVGMKAVFVVSSWKRCIKMLKHGQVDGLFAAIWSKPRDKWGVFPKKSGIIDNQRSLWEAVYTLYVNNTSPILWDGSQLQNVTDAISTPLGYIAEKELRKLGVLSKKSYAPGKGLELVSRGLLDGYVAEQVIGRRFISKLDNPKAVKSLPTPFMVAHLHAPLSHQFVKKHPEFKERFWDALRNIREGFMPN